jgi:cell division protein FtsB
MMRPPYRSPEGPAPRYLRVPPRERFRRKRLVYVGAAAVAGYLAWAFIGTESGLLRIQALRRENADLERKKVELTARAAEAEQARKAIAKDPLLEERVARERFHLVKEGEVVYFYQDAPGAPTPSPGSTGESPKSPAPPDGR